MVVIVSPRPRQLLRCRQTLELLHRQELVPLAAVEALRVAVLPGSIGLDIQRLLTRCSHLQMAPAMNSGPLSLRTIPGTPRIANNFASTSITSSLVMLRSTFSTKHSRVYSSTRDSHFIRLPLVVRSNTISQHQTWFQRSVWRTLQPVLLVPALGRFRCFLGTFSPSRRHKRYTRVSLACQLSRRSRRPIRR